MLKTIRMRLSDERGATAVEYSVMVVLIAAVIVVSVGFLGGTTSASIDCAGKSWLNKTAACSAGGSSGGSSGGGSSTSSPAPSSSPTSGGGNGNNGNGNGGVGQGNGGGNAKH